MKLERRAKIIELIGRYEIETQLHSAESVFIAAALPRSLC